LVQRNGFTCRFQALKHRPLGNFEAAMAVLQH
jgi:hypothetical protein